MIKAKSSEGKKKPKINIITKGPLKKQVIIPIVKSNTELIVNLAYQHITNIKSDIIADLIQVINEGVNITMNKLANPSDLTIIKKVSAISIWIQSRVLVFQSPSYI